MTNKEYNKIYRIKHKDKIAEKRKYSKQPEKVKIRMRLAMRKYYNKNKNKFLEYNKLNRLKKMSKNPQYTLQLKLSNSFRTALKRNKTDNSPRFLFLVGCTISEYKAFIKSKFLPGMTWDNWGSWHIDHIIPYSKFDLTKDSEIKKCFHFSNTQPLWAKDNIKKGNKTPASL